jgi:two-component system phosphate regulon sensor histidine kinase PhoR
MQKPAIRFRSVVPALVFTALGLLLVLSMSGWVRGELRRNLSDHLAVLLEGFCETDGQTTRYVAETGYAGFFLLLGPDGNVLRESPWGGGSPALSAFREDLTAGRVPTRWMQTTAGDKGLVAVYRSVALSNGDGRAYGVSDAREWIGPVDASMTAGLIAVGFFGIFGLFWSLRSSRKFIVALGDLTDSLEALSEGQVDARVFNEHGENYHSLYYGANRVSEKMEQLAADLERGKEELSHLLAAIPLGILILDERGRIALFNAAAQKASSEGLASGRFYWEFFRDMRFIAIVDRILGNRETVHDEARLQGRQWICEATWLSMSRQALVTLYDATDMRELERMKRDFAANVSHELKTPLTSIRGFLETLEGMENDPDKLQYLEIASRNAERLSRIVSDLLLLSQAEDGVFIEDKPVELEPLLASVTALFNRKADEKGLVLELRAEKDLPRMKGDAFLLEQAFANLVDNAIKYTDVGKVSIAAALNGGNIEVRVSDTGIGIPSEHHARLFERFYTVDKSRSRKLGGTGLGLSIVKHIVMQHGGTVQVESRPGGGTVFSVRFPADLRKER